MKQRPLGDVLRQARETQELSIRQLAELIEAAPSQVLRWETGERLPKTAAIMALAEQLELPATKLLALAGKRPPASLQPSIPAMLRADYDLPPEAIQEIEQHIVAVAKKYRRRKKAASKSATTSTKQAHSERRET